MLIFFMNICAPLIVIFCGKKNDRLIEKLLAIQIRHGQNFCAWDFVNYTPRFSAQCDKNVLFQEIMKFKQRRTITCLWYGLRPCSLVWNGIWSFLWNKFPQKKNSLSIAQTEFTESLRKNATRIKNERINMRSGSHGLFNTLSNSSYELSTTRRNRHGSN